MKLQEFSFGNFRSFKDINTLNLSAAKIKSKHENIDQNNVITGNNIENVSFLKSKAIYGANASGKSNIIDAFWAFIEIIQYSVRHNDVLQWIYLFRLSTEKKNQPSFFQIIFWENNVKYRYGFEADYEKIHAEWLYGKSGKREQVYFIREGNKLIELDQTNFAEGHQLKTLMSGEGENQIFRDNSLLISTLATFGFAKLSIQLVNCITSIFIIGGLDDEKMYKYVRESIKDKVKKKFILNILKYGDIGIEDLEIVELPSEKSNENSENSTKINIHDIENRTFLISHRKNYDKNNKYINNSALSFKHQESDGTRKLFELSPFIYQALEEGRVIIIDEFDARFHPLLTKKILELFNSKENKGAQLIFTTHDTNLLSSDLLRRDQVEFVEKDKYGASHLYSLVQFKGIRNNATFQKDYINGKYGAIPFLGNFNKILNFED